MQLKFVSIVFYLFIAISQVACDGGSNDEAGEQVSQLLPWNIEVLADGRSRVFTLELDKSTLGDATKVFGPRFELGLFENKNKLLTLEAYYQEVTLSGLSAKVILSLEISPQQLQQLKQRAVKRKPLESGSIKYILSAADVAASHSLVINAIGYIPYINLDEDIIEKRFGVAEDKITTPNGKQHYLYPSMGLDLILDNDGKELLQYVAPKNFSRLSGPLKQAMEKS